MTEFISVQRLNPRAKLPVRAHEDDAGLDLFSIDAFRVEPGQVCRVSTGIALRLPDATYGQIAGRSSLALLGVFPVGGVIDRSYTGEVAVLLMNTGPAPYYAPAGAKVAQLIVQRVALPFLVEVAELPPTERGSGGFGSTNE